MNTGTPVPMDDGGPTMRYRITHSYLTVDADGQPVVEHQECDAELVNDIVFIVESMIANPGGRSGTTISLHVAALDSVRV